MSLNIVVVDGFTLNPGDLSWDAVKALGEVTIFERTSPAEVLSRCRDADVILTNKVVIDRQLMSQLPKLKYLGVMATGYNVVDLDATKSFGVVVTNIPAYGPASVAQFVFSLLLSMTQPVEHYRQAVNTGRWSRSQDFCFYDHSTPELAEMTLGIVGYGAIGQKVSAIALGFGMKVLVVSRKQIKDLPQGIQEVTLNQMIVESDVISLHCPLTDDNKGLVDKAFLEAMKSTAYLINTARGPLINESDLASALHCKQIAGAALDVLSVEPPDEGHPLIGLENCIVTPHIAWSTVAARKRLMAIAVKNIESFLEGKPQNVVN